MATFVGNMIDGQIIVVVLVSVSGEAGRAPKACSALMDTGAQTSMISRQVVEGVGLMAIGHMNIIPVTGQATPTEKYRIRLDIPISSGIALPSGDIAPHNVLSGLDLEAGKLPYQPHNHDVLLGMDFLASFHITMYGGDYIMSK